MIELPMNMAFTMRSHFFKAPRNRIRARTISKKQAAKIRTHSRIFRKACAFSRAYVLLGVLEAL